MEKKRCFVAVNLPVELKKEIFETLSKKIPARECKVVEERNLHLTLAFLGYLEEKEIEKAQAGMRTLEKEKAFEIGLEGAGSFNSRVFWIGVGKGKTELENLAVKLQKILPVEDTRFSAHLTIARNKSLQKREAEALLSELQKTSFSAGFRAETIDFMESVLSPKAPEYAKLFSIALQG